MPDGYTPCRPDKATLVAAAVVLCLSMCVAFEYNVCREEDLQCAKIVDDVVYFYPQNIPSGTSQGFFELKMQLVEVVQKNKDGFVTNPVINSWADCGLEYQDRIESPDPTPSQTSIPSATPTASGPAVTPSPSPSFGAPASESPSKSVSDSPVPSPSPTATPSFTSASVTPTPSVAALPYQEAVVRCAAVGGPQGVFMEVAVQVYQVEHNITAMTPGDDPFVVPFKAIKVSYKVVWSTDPRDLSTSDTLELKVKSSWCMPNGLFGLSLNQVNNIPEADEAWTDYAAASGNGRGYKLDMISRAEAIFPDNALQCDALFGCSPERSQVNLTMETGDKEEVGFFMLGTALGPTVEVPLDHTATFKVSGVRLVTTLDPIVTIHNDGLLLAGSVDTQTALLVGLASLVGLILICTCCCCCLCPACPVYKARSRKKLMDIQMQAAAKEADHVTYTKAGGGKVDTPGPTPSGASTSKTLSPSSIVPLTEAEPVIDGGELETV